MKGFFKFVGILVIICFFYETIKEDQTNNSSIQTISAQQSNKNDSNTKVFRYKQCEEIHSKDYCYCLLDHVERHISFIDKMVWLNGGPLTNAEGIKALAEAEILCKDIDQIYSQKMFEERKKEEENLKKHREEKQMHLLNYNQEFCNVDSFIKLLDSHNEFKKEQLRLPIENIELVELSGEKVCKIDFRCSWCGKDNITTELFFKKTASGKLEFDVNKGTNATNTLYFLALWINNPETTLDLISKGADVNYKYKENTDSFFTSIIRVGSKYSDIAKICIENGADIHTIYTISDNFSKTIYKSTPLMMAINGNNLETAKLLLQKGVDPNIPHITIKENGERTEILPIERVIPVSDPEWLKLLLSYGVKLPEYSYVDGQKMPLIWAVLLDNPDNLIERLDLCLSNGAYVDAEFILGKEIKTFNTDWTVKRIKPDYQPHKPIEYAEKNKMLDVIQLFQKYGAKPQYEITDLKWCSDGYSKQICGIFTNNSKNTLKTIFLRFNLYDNDNARIGEALATIDNLSPKEKWKFKTFANTENVKSYKLSDISIYDF